MEQGNNPMVGGELQKMHILALGERRRPHYKWKYEMYKKIAIALFVLLSGVAFLLGLTLRGNLALQQRLNDSKTITILPSGKTLGMTQ